MRKTGADMLRNMGKRTVTRYIKEVGKAVGSRYMKDSKKSLPEPAGRRFTGKKLCVIAGRILAAALFLSLYAAYPAFAATGTTNTGVIKTGFGVVYDIIAAIISSVGQLYLLWGVFEWATALNSQDGTMQSMAFKRIAAGLVACLTPQLIPLVTAGIK